MSVLKLPFSNGFYESSSLPLSAQECLNMYPRKIDVPALSQQVLFGTAGITQKATTGSIASESNRGSIAFLGDGYVVNGGKLHKVTVSAGTVSLTEIGDIGGTGRVSLAVSLTQIMVLVPGGKGYIYTGSTNTLEEITDTDFTASGNPTYVVFIDSFFVCSTDENKFIKSASNDGSDWDALDFSSADSDPDRIIAPIVYSNQLFIGGEKTFEAYTNVGGADFPFQRSGLFLDKGVYAPFSLVNSNDSFMFIGGGENESPAVWKFGGGGLQKISTPAIDSELQRFTQADIENSFSWSYSQDGAYFVGFSFISTTFVYEEISGLWHERKSNLGGSNFDSLTAYRVASLMTIDNDLYVADNQDGRIGRLEIDTYSEYGNNIFRRFSTMPFQNNMKSLRTSSLELTTESGVGNDDVADPVVRMDSSVNARTYSQEKSRHLGKVGQFNARQIWRRIGRAARMQIFRFSMTDKAKFVALELTANIHE